MNEREQIINFLLQACDAKNRAIDGLQKENAELKKQLDEFKPKDQATQ